MDTINDRLIKIERLLGATRNLMAAAESEPVAATRNFQHKMIMVNLRDLADLARTAERDVADSLNNPAFQRSIGLGYTEHALN